ncbi:MAG: NAD(P)H-dependent oxidoreductase subunit E [Desulfobacteraceae bacterium]|nr:NAD(P)H-dependent oxidoreductase subunit E [Desulfobacteraceae bacterium]
MHQGELLDDILDQYPEKPEYLIFLLQDIQSKYGYISQDSMGQACEHAGVPLTQGYSVATFYQSFRLDPSGEHDIRVCMGTACHLKGAQRIVDDLSRKLNIKSGETTQDLRYTLSTVNCVGACALAPVIVVDEEYKSGMTAKKMDKQLKIMENELTEDTKEQGNA